MKRVLMCMAIAALTTPEAFAQATGGPPGGGRPAMARRAYDPATVTTVSGDVASVTRIDGRRGGQGIHVVLNTSDGPLDVHLGPASYLDRQPLKVAKGDAIQVTGSKVELRGKPALIAKEVKKGDAALTLRDENGVPVWRGQRRR